MELYNVVKVAIDKATFRYDLLYSYKIPSDMQKFIEKGIRVIVPFGSSNSGRQAIVFDVEQICSESDLNDLKDIMQIIDKKPILSQEMLNLVQWMKEHTFCTYFEAVKTLLPPGINIVLETKCKLLRDDGSTVAQFLSKYPQKTAKVIDIINNLGIEKQEIEQLKSNGVVMIIDSTRSTVRDDRVKMVRLANDEIIRKITEKQEMVIQQLKKSSGVSSIKELCYQAVVTKSVVDSLIKKGILESFEDINYRDPYVFEGETDQTEIVLTDQQQNAYNQLKKMCDSQKAAASLLFGITGSGKTSVYLKLIDHVLSKNKQVIVLVPEISLTPQTVKLFYSRFGNQVAVLHSALSAGERYDQYKKIKDGKVTIVVGTRSAVFAPFNDLGLIVIDEEQEATYRSESSPRYHARDIAKFRCKIHNALLLMCSATPSIVSYYHSLNDNYRLLEINERYSGVVLPEVFIVDMRDEIRSGNGSSLSSLLKEQLMQCISKGEQAIILLNRRGYNTLAECIHCGQVIKCPHCSVSLTYHSANNSLVCHYCGFMKRREDHCESCGSEYIRYQGYGTQKLEEELKESIPGVRIIRMDADTTSTKESHQFYFDNFEKRNYDILIGTQMIAKGLDFDNVTLAAVLSADNFLYNNDYKSYEKTFSLITQVVGRSGRRNVRGKAVIQTFTPDNQIIALAAVQDYKRFYEEEIEIRKTLLYPPFCDICVIGINSKQELNAKNASVLLMDLLKNSMSQCKEPIPIRAMGPFPSSIYKLNNKYRYRIVIKCKNTILFRESVRNALKEFSGNPKSKGTAIFCDMYYEGSI